MKTIKNNSLKLLAILLLTSLLLGNCAKNKTVAEPPSGSITINNNDLTTQSNQVKLNLSASDKTGVTGYYVSEAQAEPDIDNPEWKSLDSTPEYSADIDFELSEGLGEKTVYVWFKNGKKKISLPESDSIEVIGNSIPANGTIIINDGATSTYSDKVDLNITVTDSIEITHYYVSENQLDPKADTTATNPGWSEANWTIENGTDDSSKYSSKVPFYLSNDSGEKTVYVWFKNRVGGISSKVSDTIIFTDRPTGSVVINNDEATTTSPVVSLTLKYSGKTAVDYYYVADSPKSPEIDTQGWKSTDDIDKSNTVHFTLSNNPGEKQVYVWFKNRVGMISPVASDTIVLEGIPGAPTDISINIKPEDTDLPSNEVTLDRIVKLDIFAQDTAGVIAYYISENSAIPTATITATNPGWISVASTTDCSIVDLSFTLSRGLGEKTVYVWFKNSDGIISPAASDTIVLADTPAGEVVINGGEDTSDSRKVTLKLTVSSGTPVTRYHVSESSTAPNAETVWNYITAKFPVEIFFEFGGEELGEKTLYVWFMNNGGMVSSVLSDTITLIDRPTGKVTIDSKAIATDSVDVTLNLAATGKVDITAYYISENSTPPTARTAGWISTDYTTDYRNDISFSFLNAESGEKKIYAWFMNEAGAISLTASDDIILADRPIGSFTINAGATDTNKFRVTLNLKAEGETAINGYYLSNRAETPEIDDSNWASIEPVKRYVADRSFTLSSSLGEKAVYVWFKNSVGLISARVSKTINLIEDKTPPEGSVNINHDDLATTSTAVTLYLSATDSFGSVAGYYASEESTTPTSGSDWKRYSDHVSFKLSSSDGNRTVYVWFKDESGNISESASDSIYLDRVAPHGGTSRDSENSNVGVTIIGGENSKTHEVKIRVTGYDAVALTGYYISDSSNTPVADSQGWHELGSQAQNFTQEIDYTLPSGDGEKTVYVWFRDIANNISKRISDRVTVDTIAPAGSVTINNGDRYARSSRVTLSLHASDTNGATGYYASESSTIPATNSNWKSYSNSVSFTLSGGDGNKTVYVWFKDAAGNISRVTSDMITMDATVPGGSVVINNGDHYTRSSRVTLKFTRSNSGNDINAYYASESSTTPATNSNWRSYSNSVSFTLSGGDGNKTVYAWFKDAAGNISPAASDSIALTTADVTAPVLSSIKINSANTLTTNSRNVVVHIKASDSIGVTGHYMSESSDKPSLSNAGWVSVASQTNTRIDHPFQLSAGDGNKTVYVWLRDAAGNISDRYNDIISLYDEENDVQTLTGNPDGDLTGADNQRSDAELNSGADKNGGQEELGNGLVLDEEENLGGSNDLGGRDEGLSFEQEEGELGGDNMK
jgi:hypothetical protein